MTSKRIFVTGASGCIGHYLTETLIQETDHELYLLVRNPAKLKFDWRSPRVHLLQGDMRRIERFAQLLGTIDVAVLVATAWGGVDAYDINILKTLKLMELLDPQKCEQVIYFSTASILDRHNELLEPARHQGTDYIFSKYQCYKRLSRLPIASRVTTLFPTLVFGGDRTKPYSHLSSGLPEVLKWANLIRFFEADGSFHFIHAKDIATVVKHLIDNPPEPARPFVLGNQAITVNEAISQICAAVGQSISFRIPLYPWLADIFISLFRIQMSSWDRFCLNYRHFTYKDPVTPATFGLTTYSSNLPDLLRITLASQPPPPEEAGDLLSGGAEEQGSGGASE
ncbi:MAG TPA: NAD(P)-dependent oxidoreductase [Oscillatoriaceae cyanobacterium M33_DOE_052]|uniref:NAD(P)-dependent oxidoreductase n=1 Tax=Planktothricoides sp. SpSt-374 TaxID=2282167 RepID=A0A7C3ZKH1_9CYAN|nr:NAD(P)-dependent oxidoreductase [Oscillatoriaceae cyanobacterium M33_DOE_052]